MKSKKSLKVLFIGNSHTYYNDMPVMVQHRASEAGFDCHVTMIAHGGWYLEQHVDEPDVARYGVEKSAEIIKNASTDYVYAS